MTINRKDFLRTVGVLTGAASISTLNASIQHNVDLDRLGVLSDLTLCIGCRKCEFACNKSHGLPYESIDKYDDPSIMENFRRPTSTQHTVVNRYPEKGNNGLPLDVKVQCMHCEHPACASACIVGALQKDPKGPVTYDAAKCIGCRYCMVACPFQVPQYQYDNALTPILMKCDLCYDQNIKNGQLPSCVAMCPREVMVFGQRKDVLALAHERIRTHPDRYIDHVYGENEVGGTSWMYISSEPFENIDLPTLSYECPSHLTENIQHGIFKGFSGPILLFGLLGLAMKLYRKDEE
ncbi:MAG: 4Fe-4S dicluster domain-containing protein [Candidatus Marinimicrobia bacterium]|nr:4Fe-4S dicluster domain-containing protein [Candidatus Neomarinimicrobiota bacterium]